MPAFVCRDDAVATVTGALERPPALVLVEGEAGVGKTRLVQECLWTGRWPDRTILMVECQPGTEPAPLGPVVDGVRRLRTRLAGVRLSPLGGALRPLFPEWIDDLPPPPEPLDEPAGRRHRAIRAMGELVDQIGVDLVVVEDAHWADAASLEWLQAACASGAAGRSVVVTYRGEDVPAGSLLWQLASRRPPRMAKVRVVLGPLDVAGVQQLTRVMLRHAEVSWTFAQFLHERTGGLPLAVEESLRLLQARGDIVREGGEWARRELEEIRVPPNVRDSVLERVRRLDRATRRVLEAAAVLDEPADDRLLAEVAGLDPSAAGAGVAVGFRVGLLRGDAGRVVFRHQLAAEAVYEAIPPVRFGQLHQRAGEALRAGGLASAGRLSRHFREAGDVDAWALYAEQAAGLAMESGDDRTAINLLYDLLTSVDHPAERRGRLARKLGEAATGGLASLTDQAEPVLQALRQALTDPALPTSERGEVRLLLARLLRWHGQREAADDEVEAAIPDLADRPDLACWAMLNLGVAWSRDWEVQDHLDWIHKAKARFGQIESPTEQLHVRALAVSALLGLGEEDGWSDEAELPRTGATPSEQRMIMLSAADVGRLAIKWGRYDQASTRLSTAAERSQAAGYQRALNAAKAGRAYLDWYTGRWEGLATAAADLATADTAQPPDQVEAREVQGVVELATGAPRAAEQRLLAVLDAYARSAPLGHQVGTAAGALGRLRLASGHVEQALQITGPVMARNAAKGLWLWAADAIWVHLDALATAGEVAQAAELADQFATWVKGRDVPAPAAASVLCQAIVTQARGDQDAAAGLFTQAAEAWAALPRPYDVALALERAGQCVVTAGDVDRGVSTLGEAHRRLRELGARWDADRVARSLRKQGVKVPGTSRGQARGDGSQLSDREREVLTLVARGMTDRDAAKVLFLSPKTVRYYLGMAMRKLGATSRTGAAVAAAEAGLISTGAKPPAAGSRNGQG